VAPNPGPMTLEGTNTYVVGAGDEAWVIDPGPADEGHLAVVHAAARGPVAGVLLTHSHADHAEAAPMLGAPVLETGPEVDAVGPFAVLPTSGHAPDHVCFLFDEVCFCGDLILGEGSSFVPPDGGSLAAYLASQRRLRAGAPDLLLPGPGPPIERPTEKIDEYIEHRLMRERRLVAALERGERSRAALLAEAWDDVPEALRPAAALVMRAHLEKLDAEGRLPEGLGD
jgi:glyoxylase-like metal-dependent hydrolase (beta-lactamase superfamily II)